MKGRTFKITFAIPTSSWFQADQSFQFYVATQTEIIVSRLRFGNRIEYLFLTSIFSIRGCRAWAIKSNHFNGTNFRPQISPELAYSNFTNSLRKHFQSRPGVSAAFHRRKRSHQKLQLRSKLGSTTFQSRLQHLP